MEAYERDDFEDMEEFDESDIAIVEDEEEYYPKKDVPPYELVLPTLAKNDKEPLKNVIGHEEQKKELISVIHWFQHSKELKERGISIPKGVILFGAPGNGKSLFIKEIMKIAGVPILIFHGEQENVVQGIGDTFRKARELKHAIIVFDELDLLINRERRVVRILQENLDGVEEHDDILVIAATNDIYDIPYPLLRHGRLEKVIKIPNPTKDEAIEILKKYFEEFHIQLPDDFDEDEVALSLNRVSCVGIKAIVNDIVLRNGFDNITSEMIDESIFNITNRVKEPSAKANFHIAIHEAGHAVVAKSFAQFFVVNKLTMLGSRNEFELKEMDEGLWTYDKVIANIKIQMAGNLAEKIICGVGSIGCQKDLEQAEMSAYSLFSMMGYSSCWETLQKPEKSFETWIKRRKMERKMEKLLKKCEKETAKIIKKNQNQIVELANVLFKKRHLKSSEILEVLQ